MFKPFKCKRNTLNLMNHSDISR